MKGTVDVKSKGKNLDVGRYGKSILQSWSKMSLSNIFFLRQWWF